MSNDQSRGTGYDPLAKTFHWLIFLLLAVQYVVAFTMPHIGKNTVPETLINLHFSLGVLIILVAVIRLLWRLTHRVSRPAGPSWEVGLAHLSHFLLYLLVIGGPLLGWIDAGARGYTVRFFDLFTVPALMAANPALAGKIGDYHVYVSQWGIWVLVALHVLAALYHHFVQRDDTLRRMLPERN